MPPTHHQTTDPAAIEATRVLLSQIGIAPSDLMATILECPPKWKSPG